MQVTLRPLTAADVDKVDSLLERACNWDRADVVAEEKLLGEGLCGTPQTIVATKDDECVAVAVRSGDRVRLLAVLPEHRACGIGSQLLDAIQDAARAEGHSRLRLMDEVGNYLAPGIDERNIETISWCQRRGYSVVGQVTNLLVPLRDNPWLSDECLEPATHAVVRAGYRINVVHATGAVALVSAVSAMFGAAWAMEVQRAAQVGTCVAAWRGDEPAGFAAADGNNHGLGWFGPAGTWPAHRNQGLGRALLLTCLRALPSHYAQSEIAWLGPRRFYEDILGPLEERRFVIMDRNL